MQPSTLRADQPIRSLRNTISFSAVMPLTIASHGVFGDGADLLHRSPASARVLGMIVLRRRRSLPRLFEGCPRVRLLKQQGGVSSSDTAL